MRSTVVRFFVIIFSVLSFSNLLADQQDISLEEMVVIGQAEGFSQTQFNAERSIPSMDAAQLMNYVPGGGVAGNGPLSGQIQYRGLFGPRLNVRIDGMLINGGGPNWMAPPLHHIPPGLLDSLTVEQGIASISTGGGLGGAVTAHWKKPDFNDSATWNMSGDVEASVISVDGGNSLSALFGIANEEQRIYLVASNDDGDDYDFPAGVANSTQYQRDAMGIGYGLQVGAHSLDIDLRRIETGETGTPSLPMDIEWFDSDLWSARYKVQMEKATIDLQWYGSDIDHRMNNYRLRMAPDFSSLMLPPFVGDDRRYVNTTSEESGYQLSVNVPTQSSEWIIGLDGYNATHEATVYDPDFAMFFVTNFNETQVDRSALFAEWTIVKDKKWYFEAGLRLENVDQRTAEVDAFPARMVDMNPVMWPQCTTQCTPPRAVWTLRERFNNTDRNASDRNIDWVLKTRYQTIEHITWEVGFAQKTRSPIYQERFLWIPLEVNAGLGDGNNYVGNLELEPEVSRQLELGMDWRSDQASLSMRAYYRTIDDYIQGIAATDMMVVAVSANANGDPTPLMFSNVDATLLGFDLNFVYQISEALRFDGLVAWVKGERDDINDNLYRVAPPNVRLGISWDRTRYQIKFEQLLVARQDKLSATNTLDPTNPNNQFSETPGYGISNLFFAYTAANELMLSAGIENLWDKQYTNHLSGFNRVLNSDVGLGGRMPGQGRSVFARLRYQW